MSPRASGGASKPNSPESAYPFLFYGRRPADWFEGPKRYELRFREAPDAITKRALARALGATLAPADEVTFSGAFACLSVEELGGEDEPEELFDRVEDILRTVHAVAPLDQVVMLTARAAGTSAWDDWTRQREIPAAGPAYAEPTPDTFHQPCDRSLAVPRRDALFDEERGNVAAAAQAADGASKAGRGKIALVPAPSAPTRPAIPGKILEAAKGHVLLRRPGGGFLAYGENNLLLLEDTGTARPLATLPGPVLHAALAPDGSCVVAACEAHPYGVVVEVELPGGGVREVFRPTPHDAIAKAHAVAYVANGAIAVGSLYFVYLVDGSSGAERHYVKCKCASGGLFSLLGGRALLARTYDGATKAFVYAVAQDKLSELSRSKVALSRAWELDGRVLADGPSGTYEVANLGAALEKASAKTRRSKRGGA